jgi:hypothetical protein
VRAAAVRAPRDAPGRSRRRSSRACRPPSTPSPLRGYTDPRSPGSGSEGARAEASRGAAAVGRGRTRLGMDIPMASRLSTSPRAGGSSARASSAWAPAADRRAARARAGADVEDVR